MKKLLFITGFSLLTCCYAAPRGWTEKAYPKLTYYNRLPKGTHFAAWEQPELFTNELRAAFKSLR
jgi:pimeloyl-ACP methyl ester carboxylesterase